MDKITTDNGWLLEGDLGSARVIEQDEVKLYRETAIVAYLDGEYEGLTVVDSNPTFVVDEDGRQLGSANIRIQNRKLVADIAIDYGTPERLAAETRDGVRHYVRVRGGVVIPTTYGNLVTFAQHTKKVLAVHTLVLSTQRSEDPRIQALGEPTLL